MIVLSRSWLLCLILTAAIKPACLASDFDLDLNRQNAHDPVKFPSPNSRVPKSKFSHTNDTEAALSQSSSPSITQQSIFPSKSEKNATQTVLRDLQKLRNKYYPKIKDWMRYVQGFENAASRVRENSAALNDISERVTDVKAAIGFILSIPLIICCSAFYLNLLVLGGIVIGFNGWDLGTLGRRRMLRDLSAVNNHSQIFDFNRGLSPEQAMAFAFLIARVDNVLSNYTISFERDTRFPAWLNRLNN